MVANQGCPLRHLLPARVHPWFATITAQSSNLDNSRSDLVILSELHDHPKSEAVVITAKEWKNNMVGVTASSLAGEG